MTSIYRRKPIALLLCYGFASALAGGFAAPANAQSIPLRVDPALLGLPPASLDLPDQPTAKKIPEPEPVIEAKPEPVIETKPEPVIETKPEPVIEAKPEPVIEAKPESVIETKPEPVIEAKPEPVIEAKPEPVIEAKPEPVIEAKPEPVIEAKPEPVIEAKPESVIETKPEPVIETKPEPVIETKPEPEPIQALTPTAPATKSRQQKPYTSEPLRPPEAAAPPPATPPDSQPVPTVTKPKARLAPPEPPAPPLVFEQRHIVAVGEPLRVDPALLGSAPPAASQTLSAEAGSASGAPVITDQLIDERDRPVDRQATIISSTASSTASSAATSAATSAASSLSSVNVNPANTTNVANAAPDNSPALVLQASRKIPPASKDDNRLPLPVFLSAERMGGDVEREFVAEGDAKLRKLGTQLTAERLTYWPIDDEVEAEGLVRLEQGQDFIEGPKMRLKLEDQVGFFESPRYFIKRGHEPDNEAAANVAQMQKSADETRWSSGFAAPKPMNIRPGQTSFDASENTERAPTEARGEADRIDFEGENQYRVTNGSYTSCRAGNDDWYLKTGSLQLDYDREVADGTDATLYFLGKPIFYSPWVSFSLNDQRKSGFLMPRYGTSTDSGVEFSVPYYWNIAPNMDATITPRILTRRGIQLSSEFRYLNSAFGGLYSSQVQADLLPSDRLYNHQDRYGFAIQHTQTTANGFSGQINYTKVSDDNYYTDLSNGVTSTSSTQLLQQAEVSYSGGGWWSATANMQQYQTLQPDPKNPVLAPYKLLPQVTVNARKPDFYTADASFLGQFTHFTRDEQRINQVKISGPNGVRSVLYPQISLPYITPGWYITPKLGVNIRHYTLSETDAGAPKSMTSSLPIVSVDSGMTFERSSQWFGKNYTQTLEPRLYYVNIPYKNQDAIPLFDTGLADFNFAQIFSENQFSSWDRINNANQLTAALTNRLLDPASGNEIMRAMLGQRFYFSKNKVGLSSDSQVLDDGRKWDRSDFLAAFNGQILPRVYVDSALQYNLEDRATKRYSVGVRYQPEPGKVLNAAYRYNKDVNTPLNQIDLSGQWPLSGRWHAVARLNYSFKDEEATSLLQAEQKGRMIEAIGGLEYNGGCWVVRGVVQRLALTQDKASTAFFIQLELNDFARIGSNPLDLLKRNIQGYSNIRQTSGVDY